VVPSYPVRSCGALRFAKALASVRAGRRYAAQHRGGTSALFSLTSGADNTAIGFQPFRNTSGPTTVGWFFRALSNTTGV